MSLLPARKPGPARMDLSGPTGSGYGPADLQSAYELAAASLDKGKGETVAIVDAYDDPTAAADLAVYRKQWGLPACAAGCLTIVNQNGQTSPLPVVDPTGGWEVEESLDLDMVSAICPNCRIVLVEANSTSLTDLGAAEDTAVGSGAKFISDSWDGPDGYGSSAYDPYFNHPGVAITVAAGDDGFGATYPAASQFVTSVGGTSLVPAPGTARGWTESAWTGTGSGCSPSSPSPRGRPSTTPLAGGCLNRTDNDVSAVADPNTPVWLYDSYPFQGAPRSGAGRRHQRRLADHRLGLRAGRHPAARHLPGVLPVLPRRRPVPGHLRHQRPVRAHPPVPVHRRARLQRPRPAGERRTAPPPSPPPRTRSPSSTPVSRTTGPAPACNCASTPSPRPASG